MGREDKPGGDGIQRGGSHAWIEMDMDGMSNESAVIDLASAAARTRGSAGHFCGPSCEVVHEWANLWRCTRSGKIHCCDSNCDERVFYDNCRTICRLSRRIVDVPRCEGAVPQAFVPAGSSSATELGALYGGRNSPALSSADSWGSFKRRSSSPAGAVGERDNYSLFTMGEGETSESKRARPSSSSPFHPSPSASPLGVPNSFYG